MPNFCEPIVSKESWDAVQEIRLVRSERTRQARQAKEDNGGKQIAAITPGLALTYMLSGLVRCGECNRSMNVSSSPPTSPRAAMPGDTSVTPARATSLASARTARGCPSPG